ncbi:MAG: hypothetical protein ABL933_05205 [Methyloglobulus sp.]|nr:hypothetical protein [Methyloglobulus sp.]
MSHLNNLFLCLFLVGSNSTVFAQSSGMMPSQSLEFEEKYAVDDSLLDKMRGGFITPDGIKIDIGVGRATFIDGVLQSQNNLDLGQNISVNGHTLSVADLQKIPMSDLSQLVGGLKTIIQNNLDNKHIANFTVLDVAVKNLPTNFFNHSIESMRNVDDIRSAQEMQLLK